MGLKNKILLIVILFMLTGCYSQAYFEKAEAKNKQYIEKITKLITKKYPNYEIKELRLIYTDWSSSVRPVRSWIEAETAYVKIENEVESRTIQLKRGLFDIWQIFFDEPDYGENVPDSYFVEIVSSSVGGAADIEKYIEDKSKLNYWYIPFEDGLLYRKSSIDRGGDYFLKYYENLYKTENGKVYEFNKEIHEWELSEIPYSDLAFYSNYTLSNKEEITKILETYRSN